MMDPILILKDLGIPASHIFPHGKWPREPTAGDYYILARRNEPGRPYWWKVVSYAEVRERECPNYSLSWFNGRVAEGAKPVMLIDSQGNITWVDAAKHSGDYKHYLAFTCNPCANCDNPILTDDDYLCEECRDAD